MKKYLTIEQIEEIVRMGSYTVDDEIVNKSRCLCGTYDNVSDLPALAIPGGDFGEVAICRFQ